MIEPNDKNVQKSWVPSSPQSMPSPFLSLVGARAGIRTRVTGVTVLYDRPDYTTRACNNISGRQRQGVPTKGSTTQIARRLYCWDRDETRCGPPAVTAVPECVLSQPFLNFSVLLKVVIELSIYFEVKSEMKYNCHL